LRLEGNWKVVVDVAEGDMEDVGDAVEEESEEDMVVDDSNPRSQVRYTAAIESQRPGGTKSR